MASGTVSEYAKISGQLSGLSHHVKINDAYFTLTNIGHLELHGEVTGADMSGSLTGTGHISGSLDVTGSVQTVYDGDYVVDPRFVSQTLETQGKVMRDDVTVNSIEVARTSNPQGGKTVYIGGII